MNQVARFPVVAARRITADTHAATDTTAHQFNPGSVAVRDTREGGDAHGRPFGTIRRLADVGPRADSTTGRTGTGRAGTYGHDDTDRTDRADGTDGTDRTGQAGAALGADGIAQTTRTGEQFAVAAPR
ncbi:hypothetical protein [Streptomyces sp. NPDC127072]|uniref:hypothetical protein n=1 Tax=Streptomyces sp. NPDC127072 TaxID=3347129 RepID=UPI00364B2426